jgi:hypothetical protein
VRVVNCGRASERMPRRGYQRGPICPGTFSPPERRSGFTGERILGVDWFSGSRHGFGQLTRLLQHAECQTGTQLTKSAPLGGDSETRTLKGPGEATWASRRAALAKLERAAFPQHWPFPASPCRRAVNQKDKEFVVGLFGSPNRTRTQNLPVNRLRLSDISQLGTSCFHRPSRAQHPAGCSRFPPSARAAKRRPVPSVASGW